MRESKKPIKVVLGCGSACGMGHYPDITTLHNQIHPSEDYHTVSYTIEFQPSIYGDLREESTLDQIRRLGEIDVLISEVISFDAFTPNNSEQLSNMLAADGIFISAGGTFHLKNAAGYFLLSPNSLFEKIQTKSRGIAVLDRVANEHFLIQHFERYSGKSMENLRVLIDKIKTLESSHPSKDPLVLSLVAQLDTYNEFRKKTIFRNYFMDATYETELGKLRERLLSSDNINSIELCALLEETQEKLPSSKNPSHLRLADILRGFESEIIHRSEDAIKSGLGVTRTITLGIADTYIPTKAQKSPAPPIIDKTVSATSDTTHTSKAPH